MSGGATEPSNRGYALQELFVRHAVLVLLCPRLAGEQGRKLAVEGDQFLGILPTFKLVLHGGDQR